MIIYIKASGNKLHNEIDAEVLTLKLGEERFNSLNNTEYLISETQIEGYAKVEALNSIEDLKMNQPYIIVEGGLIYLAGLVQIKPNTWFINMQDTQCMREYELEYVDETFFEKVHYIVFPKKMTLKQVIAFKLEHIIDMLDHFVIKESAKEFILETNLPVEEDDGTIEYQSINN